MSNIKMPEFLTRASETTPYSEALEAYGKKFGYENFSTEDKIMTQEQWVEILTACVKKGVELDEYLELGKENPEDYI